MIDPRKTIGCLVALALAGLLWGVFAGGCYVGFRFVVEALL